MITFKEYQDLLAICDAEESEDRASDDLVGMVEDLICSLDETKFDSDQKAAFATIIEFTNARDLYAGIHWEFKKLIDPDAWNQVYKLDDFTETMDRGGIWVHMMEEDHPGSLWESVAVCIASNFGDAWGGTDAPKSKVEVDYDITPFIEYAEYANIIVIDRGSSENRDDDIEKMLVINTLTGQSFEY